MIYSPRLNRKVGGQIVLHKLAQDLTAERYKAMLFCPDSEAYANEFCDQFATARDIDDDTVVVYPEIIPNNPLRAKNVVRWMLCDMQIHSDRNIWKTWDSNDLVFHYSSFNRQKDSNSLAILRTSWINPIVQNHNLPREGSCYLFKKACAFHRSIKMIHPKDAIMIDDCSFEEIIDLFNKKEFFYSYDPYSFYDIIALLCGCIPVIFPVAGVTESEWFETRAFFSAELENSESFPGLAYGFEGIAQARKTLSNFPGQFKRNSDFEKKSIRNFICCTQEYFFQGKHTKAFPTVQKIAQEQGWSQEASVADHIHELRRLGEEISVLRQIISMNETKTHSMESTNFQKFREAIKKGYRFVRP